jgi:hypothetical protein
MRIGKAKGRPRGKQPKLNPRQETHLVALLKSGEYANGAGCGHCTPPE